MGVVLYGPSLALSSGILLFVIDQKLYKMHQILKFKCN